jgi:hypothetical protein
VTTPDRTEDLLRLMLERRAGAPPPGWLLPSVAEHVRQSRQARARPSMRGARLRVRRRGLALIAVAALLLALPAGVLVTARLINRGPTATQPAIGFAPSPSAAVTANPSRTPQATDAPSQAATPGAGVPLAVVTTAGDGLRVRSRPEVSADSKKLSPLLATGNRMLVVNGPVPADGYEWYEVLADNDLFGWVAAGKDGEDWIAPAPANCTDDLDESALRTVDPIDFFVCYGDTPVRVKVGWSSLENGGDVKAAPTCPYTGDPVHCSARPNWLFEPHDLVFDTPGASPHVLAAARGSVLERMRAVPEPTSMTLTIAMDAPQAQNCRITDDRGRDLITRDEAVTRCRLQFVVRDVAADP